MDSINVPLSMVGGNDIVKGVGLAGRELLAHAPTLARWGGKALSEGGSKIVNMGRNVASRMGAVPILNHLPAAFGSAKKWETPMGNLGTYIQSRVPNFMKPLVPTAGGLIRPAVRSAVESPFTQIGNTQNMRAAAGQRAEGAYNTLNSFTGAMGQYGARSPGELGPHNAALTSGPGYEPAGYPLYRGGGY
jgi:hypothetical protein